jgi:hypothetical protein
MPASSTTLPLIEPTAQPVVPISIVLNDRQLRVTRRHFTSDFLTGRYAM